MTFKISQPEACLSENLPAPTDNNKKHLLALAKMHNFIHYLLALQDRRPLNGFDSKIKKGSHLEKVEPWLRLWNEV